jgi:large subunit ribosomal protein L29
MVKPLKSSEIREMDKDAREVKLAGLEEEYFNLRFQLRTGQLDNISRIKQVKRNIARIKTLVREDELNAQKSAGA